MGLAYRHGFEDQRTGHAIGDLTIDHRQQGRLVRIAGTVPILAEVKDDGATELPARELILASYGRRMRRSRLASNAADGVRLRPCAASHMARALLAEVLQEIRGGLPGGLVGERGLGVARHQVRPFQLGPCPWFGLCWEIGGVV